MACFQASGKAAEMGFVTLLGYLLQVVAAPGNVSE